MEEQWVALNLTQEWYKFNIDYNSEGVKLQLLTLLLYYAW